MLDELPEYEEDEEGAGGSDGDEDADVETFGEFLDEPSGPDVEDDGMAAPPRPQSYPGH
jgi:hypothetical protein